MCPGQVTLVTEDANALNLLLYTYLHRSVFHTRQHRTRKRGRASDEEQFSGRRFAVPQTPTTAPAGGRLGWLKRKDRSGRPREPPVPGAPAAPRTRDGVAAAAVVAVRDEGDGSEAEWRCG